jgi:citrate lyase subunit beta/citryl-CoA lyase
MRSLLFVPADSERKLDKALASGADMLLIDLEDSVAPAGKEAARRSAAAFIRRHGGAAGVPKLYVRVNGLATGLIDEDLAAVCIAGCDGIMLPKAEGGPDVSQLDAKITVREALEDLPDGAIRITAIATETARGVFRAGTYRGASERLMGLAWGAEDLAADIGASANRDAEGRYLETFRFARLLALLGAADAGVPAIDGIAVDFRDAAKLEAECAAAARDGFSAKMAIHPAQVPVINRVFTPSADEVAAARRVIDAFAAAGDAGVVAIDGKMVDRPHLTQAERILSRAGLPLSNP